MPFPKLPRPAKLFFAADVLVGLLYIVNQAMGHPYAKINRLVDLDGEANLPTWYSSLQWAATAGLFAFVVYRQRRRRAESMLPLLVIAVVFLALSLDEVAQIHEKLSIGANGKMGAGEGGLRGLWLPILGIPMLGVVAIAARKAKTAFDDSPGSFLCLMVGMVVFGLGAFGVEPIVLRFLDSPGHVFVYLEETMEMVGVTFILWCGYIIARREGMLAFDREGRVGARLTPDGSPPVSEG